MHHPDPESDAALGTLESPETPALPPPATDAPRFELPPPGDGATRFELPPPPA